MMNPLRRPLVHSIGHFLTCAALLGCVGGQKLAPVVGKVTVNGAPLKTGSVTFHPNAGKGNTAAQFSVGSIDSQGSYKLVTAEKEGAPLGWFKVAVTAQEPSDPTNPYALPKHLIPAKYADASTSGLEVEVVASPTAGGYDIKLAP